MMARLFQNYRAEVLFSTGRGGLTIPSNDQRDLKCFPCCIRPSSHTSSILGWGVSAQIADSHALVRLPRSLGGGKVLFL